MKNEKLSMEQLNRISVEEFKSSKKFPVILVLNDIRSMNNIGSIFRTADAFRVSKIYLCGITATPPNREINKTALGATQSVEWQYFESALDCVNSLKERGWKILCLEQTSDSVDLQAFRFENYLPCAIVLGNEVDGVQQEIIDVADKVIEIPQYGTKHSLNVSVSCGIALWDFHCKTTGKLE